MQLRGYRIKICKIAYDKCFIIVYDKTNIARSKSCKEEELGVSIAIAVLTFIGGIAPLVAQLLKAVM
ncbi:hypothetical protein NPM06_30155 [Bacillus cereus]|uniref:hypothetical protein n=1 Tax=Bacillus cereus TaxID=1396 RepID=UPI0021130E4B|nr:hypothetical protein [Bacillus cereus]